MTKVGLLTLPIIYNYGGILQAYALHKTINSLGVECTLIDMDLPIYPYYRRPLSIASRLIGKYLRHENCEIFPYWMPKKTERIISQNTRRFVEKHINPRTPLVKRLKPSDDKYDTYIVGSDQVWRRSVTLPIGNYLFDFVERGKRKSAYAASFGVDHWEFSPSHTKRIKALMSDFEYLTVRETSAVKMISEHLGLDSHQVLDPTLLLDKQEYNNLIMDKRIREDNYIFTYILDESPFKSEVIENISNIKGLPVEDIMPKSKLGYSQDAKKHIYAPVEDWLRCFRDCEFVITDSFHGTVFSIIYNKPFVVLKNPKRGNTRMESLLKLFDMEERMVDSLDKALTMLNEPIEWIKVNFVLNQKKKYSVELLNKMISNG